MIINEVKLKELLKKRGITKSALCDEIGISSRTIAKIGKSEDINDKVAQKIAEFFKNPAIFFYYIFSGASIFIRVSAFLMTVFVATTSARRAFTTSSASPFIRQAL